MPQVPGTPSYGQGGWGTHPGRLYDWSWSYELAHLGASGLVTTASKRNPYVWVAATAIHWISHQDPYRIADVLGILPSRGVGGPLPMRPGMSPGGGGPRAYPISTNPPSIEEVGRLLNQRDWGRSTSYTKFNGKRPRCPSGYRWDKKRRKCVRIRKY